MKHFGRVGLVAALVATAGIVAACTTPTPAPPQTWTVTAQTHTNLDQNEFQESPGFPTYATCPGGTVPLVRNCWDEPYIMQIGWRVTYGVADSAQSWVVGTDSEFCESTSRPYGPNTCDVPESYGKVTFDDVKPLNVVDVLAGNAKLELLGVMTLAWEKDLSWTGGPGSIANQIGGLLETALNDTVAAGSLPNNVDDLVDGLIDTFTAGGLFGPAGSLAFQIIQDGITSLGNPDDIMGMSLSVFPAVTGDLLGLVNSGLNGAGYLGAQTLSFPVDIIGELGVVLNIRGLGNHGFDLDFVASETGILNSDGAHRYGFSVQRQT